MIICLFVEDSMSFDQDYWSLFCQPEASEPIDTQRQIWLFSFLVEDSMSIDRDYFSLLLPSRDRQSSLMACGDKYGHSHPFCYPETIESDGTPRRIMVIRTLFAIERQSRPMACGDKIWSSATPVNQRQASSLTRKDKYGHLLPLSKIQCLSTETIAVPPVN